MALVGLAAPPACGRDAKTAPMADARPAAPPLAQPASAGAGAIPPTTVDVQFQSGPYKLRGVVMRPTGTGPFPVLVYNHGSQRDPSPEFFGELGRWFQAHGYVVFFPYRRGASGSEGPHWEDEADRHPQERERVIIEQLDAQSDDVLASVDWVRTQGYADPAHIAVAGCSFGGIETVLTAERSSHVYAAVDFAGASMSWSSSLLLQERMRNAVRKARVPVFFVQAENDFNTTPSVELSAEMDRARVDAHALLRAGQPGASQSDRGQARQDRLPVPRRDERGSGSGCHAKARLHFSSGWL